MPIDELTTDEAAYPRLGILRKGSPKKKIKKNGKTIEIVGDDLDHFRFVTDHHDVLKAFKAAYGDKPRRINAFLPFATKDENLDAWMKEYGKGGVKVKCWRPKDREDGIVLWQEDGVYRTDPKPCQWPNCGCSPYGVLTVIIPELVPVGGVGAVWVLTTSWNDCHELSRNLAAAETTARGLGMDLRGIPFILYRRLDDVSTPPRDGSHGARVRSEKWMLHIEPNPAWVAEQLEAQRKLASPLNAPMLNAPQAGPSIFDEMFEEDESGEIEQVETEIMPDDEPIPAVYGEVPKEARTATNLLKYANDRLQVPFDSIAALRAELAEAGLEGNSWPHYSRDPGWWQAAFDFTMSIGESKEYAEIR